MDPESRLQPSASSTQVSQRHLARRTSSDEPASKGAKKAPLTVLATMHTPMTSRDPFEAHRASTNLELLFDLTLVIAISTISAQFSEHVLINGAGSVGEAVLRGTMTFSACWICWMGFVWFATGYDVDDFIMRIGTLGQMAGVLVIANGVPAGFQYLDFAEITWGYVIMRVFYIVFFRLRAAYQNPPTRIQNLKHAGLTILLQVGWVGRLWSPSTENDKAWVVSTFSILGCLEFLLPFVAENFGTSNLPFHPHHVAERYGGFTIIIIGECILSISTATKNALSGGSLDFESIKIGLGGLIFLFTLWYLYFIIPFGHLLSRQPHRAFLWGYGHYVIHAPLTFVAAGLSIAAQVRNAKEDTAALGKASILIIGVSSSLYIVLLNLLSLMLTKFRFQYFGPKIAACTVLLLMSAFLPNSGALSVGDIMLLLNIPVLLLLGYTVVVVGLNDPFGLGREEDSGSDMGSLRGD
ncbi:bacterial low temperature requirement A protein-domain-containing protein [Chytriomyces sp. MP71]|nr:bacterial low temperature requirement A protein-domain-containing protein [Chytriomyces sp. MP71]